jgi:hypothetical protein
VNVLNKGRADAEAEQHDALPCGAQIDSRRELPSSPARKPIETKLSIARGFLERIIFGFETAMDPFGGQAHRFKK